MPIVEVEPIGFVEVVPPPAVTRRDTYGFAKTKPFTAKSLGSDELPPAITGPNV